jgi:DNA (cytosine-5)-methyltransferase 1
MSENKLNYISLFSAAGIGCYGFKSELFECLSTCELLEKRIKFQKFNKICKKPEQYICGDITDPDIQLKLFQNIGNKKIDVLIATPPCQGMSVANHKKKDELGRNSLVVESIKMCKEILPKYFIFENVRSFLKTLCTDTKNELSTIKDTINFNLEKDYNILYKTINLQNHGSQSSRPRSIVIGVRKDLNYVNPYDVFPEISKALNLKELISDLTYLNDIGEIDKDDIYHNFRNYDNYMRSWISDLKEGESAFSNTDKLKIPHRIIDNKVVHNKNKNSDKYKRNFWNKVGPCIHTRNDILASQNTVHPEQDRVFSIRELMRMMTIPSEFKWSEIEFDKLNKFSNEDKIKFLKKNEFNIRSSIGEAVPTQIMTRIAKKIKFHETFQKANQIDLEKIISIKKLHEKESLIEYIRENKFSYSLLKICEYANSNRQQNHAYYTNPNLVFSALNTLPNFEKNKELNILEPSVGVGNFLPSIIQKYQHVERVNIDLIDIDPNTLDVLKEIIKKINPPSNFKFNFLNIDYLDYNPQKDENQFSFEYNLVQKYDLIIGNPPFGKISKQYLDCAKFKTSQIKTQNIFAFFLEKSLFLSKNIVLIIPKSFLNAPEFSSLRDIVSRNNISNITDHGEKGFGKDVKIETISITINNLKKNSDVEINSFITKSSFYQKKSYIFDQKLPSWLIYRNEFFDSVCNKMHLNVFSAYRDRQITKKHTKSKGKFRVLKSRNIDNLKIKNIKNYDSYLDNLEGFSISKFLNDDAVLVPNLTYYPRACFLPKDTIVDGSVAILKTKGNIEVDNKDLEFYSSSEFRDYYKIARNYGTRSLNIDNKSVYFFGILKAGTKD